MKIATQGKAILVDKKVVPCFDLIEWAKWNELANRRVANTDIGNARVSTVFLGLDHSWLPGKPLWFETMVFGGALDQECERYETWEEGHNQMVQRVVESRKFKNKLQRILYKLWTLIKFWE